MLCMTHRQCKSFWVAETRFLGKTFGNWRNIAEIFVNLIFGVIFLYNENNAVPCMT